MHRHRIWSKQPSWEAYYLGSRCCPGKPPPDEGLDPCLAQNDLAQCVTEVSGVVLAPAN